MPRSDCRQAGAVQDGGPALRSSARDQDSRQSGCITQSNPADCVWRTAHSWEEIECECLCECVSEGPGGPGEGWSLTPQRIYPLVTASQTVIFMELPVDLSGS